MEGVKLVVKVVKLVIAFPSRNLGLDVGGSFPEAGFTQAGRTQMDRVLKTDGKKTETSPLVNIPKRD